MKDLNLRLFGLSLFLAALVGCGAEKSEDFVSSGRAFLDKGDYPAAIIQLKNAVQKDGHAGEGRYWLGVALRRTGDLPAAEIELRKAMNTDISNDVVLPELLAVLLEANQFEKVLREADRAKVVSPRAHAELLSAKATATLATGRIEEARSLANAAAAADPSNAAPFVVRARLALVDRKVDEAQQVLTDALTKVPDDYDALRLKADLTLAQGQGKAAIALYDRVLAVRPTSMVTYLALVPALLRERDEESASARLATLKRIAPGSAGTRYLEALVAYSKGDRLGARDAVRQVLKTGSDYAPALLLAGTVEYELGNYLVAEDVLRKVAAANPGDRQSRRLLVSVYLRTNQVKKAQEALSTLVKIDPDSVPTNLLAGQVATAAREPAKAAAYFQKAVSLDPRNAVPRAMLGATNMMRGDVERGVAELEAASASDVNRIEADVALVQFYLQQKQFDKAVSAVDALARKQPKLPQTANLRGGVLLAKGRIADARKAFEEALALEPTFMPAANNLAALDLRDKKPENAANRYRSILAKNPKQVEASLRLAVLLQRIGDRTGEIDKILSDAVTADPANVQARLAQVGRLQQTGRKRDALDAAQKALAALPDDPRLLRVFGRAQSINGEHIQAATTFGKLAALEPHNVDPLVMQASAYAAARDFDNARSTLSRAIALHPDNLMLRTSLVDLGLAEDRPEVAIDNARSIQKKWPKMSVGYVAEAMVLMNQRRLQEAEALLRGSLRTVDDAGVAIQLFSLLTKTDRGAEAEKFAADWIASKPKDAALAAAAGQQSLAREDYSTAARWYRAALKARPENPLVLNNLAWALGQLKDPQAMATAEKARALAPNNAGIIDTIGWLQLQQGDTEAAVRTLARAVSLAPGAAPVRMNLARALIAAGRKDDAKEQLEAIVGLTAQPKVKEEAEKLLGSL